MKLIIEFSNIHVYTHMEGLALMDLRLRTLRVTQPLEISDKLSDDSTLKRGPEIQIL